MRTENERGDSPGRNPLPLERGRETLKEGNEAALREGGPPIPKAQSRSDLTHLFDSLEVDLTPDSFKEWKTLKAALEECP